MIKVCHVICQNCYIIISLIENDVTTLLIQQSKALVANGNVQGLIKFEHGPHHHHSGSHSSDHKDDHHHHHHQPDHEDTKHPKGSHESPKNHHPKGGHGSSEAVFNEEEQYIDRYRRATDLAYDDELDIAVSCQYIKVQ